MQQPSANNYILSIKEEQAIEEILIQASIEQQSGSQPQQPYKLDVEIEILLQQSQKNIEEEYEHMAELRFNRHRQAINFEHQTQQLQEMFKLGKEYIQFDDEQINEEVFQIKGSAFEVIEDQPQENNMKYTTDTFIRYGFEEDSNEQQQPQSQSQKIVNAKNYMIEHSEEYMLDRLEKEKLLRNNKEQEQQVLFLDSKYPKINPLPMLKHQYPIFKFTESSTLKYLKYCQYFLSDITAAITIVFNNDMKWSVIAIGELLLIFITDNWKEPISMIPQPNKKITLLSVSPDKKHLAVCLTDQIIIYSIKREEGLILVKNFCELNATNISKVMIYQDKPIRVIYLDNEEQVRVFTIDKALFFTKVSTNNIVHGLDIVLDFDVLVLSNGTNLLALASRDQIALFTLEPTISALQKTSLRERTAKDLTIRWRNNFKLKKPQLFVSYNNKVEIYKMSVPDTLEKQAKQFIHGLLNLKIQPLLLPHLIYSNHYDIIQMEILSETHLLLRSCENIVVIAIPLIPSSMEINLQIDNDDNQMFEAAIVYISEEKNCRILHASFDQVFFYSQTYPQSLRITKIKSLNEYLDELMLQNSLYRESFILLILVYRGVNYSFRFSYTNEELKNLIYSAIDCTLSSLMNNLDKEIIQFKVGWICQLAVETRNDNMLWGPVYRKLHEKNYISILFNLLELFVLRDQITNMPEHIFFKFINHLCENGKDAAIEKIIINNKQEYDGSKLITLIHSKQRYYLQFFLFANSIISEEADFYTPFVKCYSAFQTYSQRKQIEKAEETGLICLWFIRKCFMFQKIPHGIMSQEQKILVITNFYIQTIEPTFTKKLSQLNLKIFLQTYLLTFIRQQFNKLLEENTFILLQKYREFYPQTSEKLLNIETKTKEEKQLKFHEIIFNHLKQSINPKIDQILWTQFASLIFHYTGCSIDFDEVIDMLIIFFENKVTQFSLELPKGMRRPTLEEVQTSLILYIKPKLLEKKDRFYMNKLLSFSDPNINHLLHRIDQRYRYALEHFLATKPQDKLIPFIYELLGDINQTQNKQEGELQDQNISSHKKLLKQRKILDLKEFLVKNINLLFKLDRKQALEIFYAIGQTSQTIYAFIEEHMAEKIYFLTAVLEKFIDEDFDLKYKFLLDHLGEICLLKDSEMLQYLNKFYYPLDKAIIVCEQKNNLLAKAIFEERSGLITEAFISYERLVKNLIMNKSVSERQIRKKVNTYIAECIRLCKLFSGENSSQNFWLRIILFINGFIKSNHQHKVFLKVEFERMLQLILREMFDFLPTTLLIQFFISKSYKLELSLSKQFAIFSNLFVLIRFDISIAAKVIDICKIDVKGNRRDALLFRKQGIFSSGICDFCQNKLEEQEKANIYFCRHAFHTICHQDTDKCLTCYYESDTSIIQNNIYGQQIRRSSFDFCHQQKQKQKNKKGKIDGKNLYVESAYTALLQSRRKKMKLYDFRAQLINNDILQTYGELE